MPPRRYRTDNIKRLMPRAATDKMLAALATMRSKSGPWMDRDPDDAEAWWAAVLRDPRARRTRMEKIPLRHPDASQRLDRCAFGTLTVACRNCKVSAVYAVDDLRASFGDDHNIRRLPDYLLPCQSKRDRREGACDLRAEQGGMLADVRTVKAARKEVS